MGSSVPLLGRVLHLGRHRHAGQLSLGMVSPGRRHPHPAAQGARWFIGLKIEGFWIACAIVFIAAGLWTLLNLPWQLAPMLIILLGVVLLGKAVIYARRSQKPDPGLTCVPANGHSRWIIL